MHRMVLQRLMVVTVFALTLAAWGEVVLSWKDGRVSLHAEEATLREVLQAFADRAVHVRVPAGLDLDRRVTLRYEDVSPEVLLDNLTGPDGYILVWNQPGGPLGPAPVLSEIRLVGAAPVPMIPPSPPAPRAVPTEHDFVPGEVLLRFMPHVRETEARALLEELGLVPVRYIPELGLYLCRCDPGRAAEIAAALAADRRVELSERNSLLRMPAMVRMPDVLPLEAPGAVAGPLIAVLDSGVRYEGGLRDILAGWVDALDTSPGGPEDVPGHGTHMVLLAGGVLAPVGMPVPETGRPVLAVRVFDEAGVSTMDAVAGALVAAVREGAAVINMSWGSARDSAVLADMMSWAAGQGVLLVAAAGNEPVPDKVYPAACPEVLAVGALDTDGHAWDQSNRGAFVAVQAPGFALVPGESDEVLVAGTSVASAYVSGLLADALAEHPGLQPRDVQQKVVEQLRTAQP